MGVRVYSDVPRIYLDMDGPMADFEKGAEQTGISIEAMKTYAGGYRNLPITAGAKEAVAQIIALGFEPWVKTKIPRANPYAATEKLLWLHELFPEIGERIVITPDKGASGREVDILIDDHPEWANAHNFKGTVLKFEFDWDETMRQVREIAARLFDNREAQPAA